MDYEFFDNLGDKKTRNKIIEALKYVAKDMDELSENVKLERTSVFYHLKELHKDGTVIKKFIGKKAYFGLSLKFRGKEK